MSAAEDFEEFVTIVQRGSLTAAARELGLPRATLGRRLGRLEERLGVRLLHRTTRRLSLTREGQTLYDRAESVVRLARQAEEEVRRFDDVPRGLLRVAVPTRVPETFTRWMVEFLGANPEVQLELVATEAVVDLVGEGFDVAMRADPQEDPSLRVRTITRNRAIAVASPAYLNGRGPSLDDCIVGLGPTGVPVARWPLMAGGTVAVSGTLTCNQMTMQLDAARMGHGIALVFERVASDALAKGEVVHVLPEIGSQERVCLVYAERRYMDPKVRAFLDHVVTAVERRRGP